MPRDLPTGLIALLKSGFAETHSTLAISLLGSGRSIKQTLYFATAAEGGSSGPAVAQPTAPAITIPNAGFETPVLGPPGYEYAPAGSSWTFTACGMIQGSLFGAAPAAEGLQGAFIQTTGSITQALSGFVAGTNYEVRFQAAQQIAGQVTHDFDVYLDSTFLGRVTPASAAFGQIVLPFTAGQSTYTLKFQGVNTAGGSVSSIIDAVSIIPVAGLGRPPGGRGIAYEPRLRQTGPVAMSLTRSADRCDVVIENIDRLAGNDFVAVQDVLYGSFAEFGRIWRDLRNPANTYQVTLLTGQIVAARASETEVQLTLMSDIYSSGAIAGQIIYGRSCPWTFKDPATCAYVGPLATCNKLLDDPDGCSGRANEFHFGGFPYIKGVDTISGAAALQQNVQYQTILTPSARSAEELEAGAKATTAIIQRHNLLLQGFTVVDDPANDATKLAIAGLGVGGNYQTLRENHGRTYERTLPPEPVLNFNESFKLTDDPTSGETDITTFGVPTGTLNLITDFKASGQGGVTTITAFDVSGSITLAAPLNLQPGNGILVEGAGVSSSNLRTTVTAVSADWLTYTLASALFTSPPAGARVQADDTAAVQNWINAKGDLAQPPGYFRISTSIIIPTTSEGFSIIVHGSGWDLSVFAFQGGGDGFVPTLPNLKIDSLVFKDLTIATATRWDATGLIDANNHGYGIRMTAPGYLGVYNNFVLERCRVIGWGCFGMWSDNMEVSWVNNCIFRENRFGHVALVAPDQQETAKLPNANVLRSNALDQAFGGGDAHRTASGSMTQPPASPTPAQTDAARRLDAMSGVSLVAADRGRVVIVHGAGTNNSDLYSFIDTVLTGSSCMLAHAAQTTVSGATVEIFSSAIASVFLNRAHDTTVDGATIQGNFTTALPTEECNAIRADTCYNLRIVAVHEEDVGGNGGAAVRLANCLSVNIENWGGSSPTPGFTNGHNADFQIINSHGVSVRNAFFNDRPQFVIDGSSSGVRLDDAWVVGYNNLWQADASWDRLVIGSGVRVAQAAEARTNQVAGNEYSYDGYFGRDLVLNGRFLDGAGGYEGWTAGSWITRSSSSIYRGGTFVEVDATAIADNPAATTVLEQLVSIPDDAAPGLYILGFDWNLDAQAGVPQTGRFVEVRLHPSSGVDEAIQWSTRSYPVVQDTWQVGHIRCFLGTGTSRTIAIRINVTPGPNNVVLKFSNFRLAAGKHIFGAWERGVSDFGGRMRAPLEFVPITNPPYPPPPTGSSMLSLVNLAGVLNLGKNGAYTPLGTTGGPGTILGPPNYFALFKPPTGDALDYGALVQETGAVHVLNSALKIDQQRPLTSFYTSSGSAATLAVCDSDDVSYFGPEWSPSNTKGGADVVIRAAHDDVSSLQIKGAEKRMTFNAPRALTGAATPLPTFFLGLADITLDGLRIQPTVSGLPLYYSIAAWSFGVTTDADFAVDQLGQIRRLKKLTYTWPDNHGPGGAVVLTNNGSGTLTWAAAPSSAHVIQDEGGPLAQMGALNFTGAGVLASNNATFPRTDITIFTAGVLQEGCVSISAQHFAGHKTFHNGVDVWDDAGGSAVPLTARVGTSGAATSGAHIQEWQTGTTPNVVAWIDTQPKLRLGIPAAATGFLELCADTSASTLQLAAGVAPAFAQLIRFPENFPTNGQILQVLTAASGIVRLIWATPAATSSGTVTGTGTVGYLPRVLTASPYGVLQDSGISDDGTYIVTWRSILAPLGYAINIGDVAGHRFNAMYVTSGYWVDTVNTTKTSPSTIGFYPFATSGSPTGDESGQILLYSLANRIHSGNQIRTVLGSYWGVELRGSRNQNAAVSAITGTSTDPCVSIISERTSVSALVVNAPNGLSGASLADFQVSGATKARVDNAGNVYGATFNTPASGVNGSWLGAGGLTINDASGAQGYHTVGQLRIETLPNRLVLSPGATAGGTGLVLVSVNGAANVQIPYGNGLAQGDYLGWDTTSGRWIRMVAPTGTGGGANIQLSNLDNSGTITSPAVRINTHLGFSVDGGWNIGAPAQRVGSMYLLGTFFMYPAGSTNPSGPKAFGFLDPAVGEYTRVLLSGNAHVAQSGNGQRLQFTSYHSFEFRGNRRNGTAPGYTTISGTDSSSVLVYLENAVDCIPLLVNTQAPITSNLFHCQRANVDKFWVNPNGSVWSDGGIRNNLRLWQPPSSGSFTEVIQEYYHTYIADTVSGGLTLQLPSAASMHGRRWHVILNRRGSGTGTQLVTFSCIDSPANDQINASGSRTLQLDGGVSGRRDVIVTADGSTNEWWISAFSI